MTELSRLFYSGRRDSGVTRAHHARAATAAEHHTMAAVSGPITGSPLRKNYSRAKCRCRRRFELQYGHALAVASWKCHRVRRSARSEGECNTGRVATPNGRVRIICRFVTGALVMDRWTSWRKREAYGRALRPSVPAESAKRKRSYRISAGPRQPWVSGSRTRPLPQPSRSPAAGLAGLMVGSATLAFSNLTSVNIGLVW
jgi:hypothetical protein